MMFGFNGRSRWNSVCSVLSRLKQKQTSHFPSIRYRWVLLSAAPASRVSDSKRPSDSDPDVRGSG
jgi:hypothetical protein